MLCHRIDIKEAPPEYTLAGFIRVWRFPTFPVQAPPFVVWAALQGGRWEGTIHLIVQRAETEEDVHRFSRWHSFTNPSELTVLEFPLRTCTFPAPGRYVFKLHAEEELLAERLLDVLPERGNP
jgi:hypothetical protein